MTNIDYILQTMEWSRVVPSNGDLRVWWSYEQDAERIHKHYAVLTPAVAALVLETLANGQVTDDSIEWNAGGLEMFEDGEWTEWYDEEGRDIREHFDEPMAV
jgi:hypothetical protein